MMQIMDREAAEIELGDTRASIFGLEGHFDMTAP
jgi:hypothetical protein